MCNRKRRNPAGLAQEIAKRSEYLCNLGLCTKNRRGVRCTSRYRGGLLADTYRPTIYGPGHPSSYLARVVLRGTFHLNSMLYQNYKEVSRRRKQSWRLAVCYQSVKSLILRRLRRFGVRVQDFDTVGVLFKESLKVLYAQELHTNRLHLGVEVKIHTLFDLY